MRGDRKGCNGCLADNQPGAVGSAIADAVKFPVPRKLWHLDEIGAHSRTPAKADRAAELRTAEWFGVGWVNNMSVVGVNLKKLLSRYRSGLETTAPRALSPSSRRDWPCSKSRNTFRGLRESLLPLAQSRTNRSDPSESVICLAR